jgi:hypothetical protein
VVLEEILSVNIIGRPSGPFSSSMGDHTTAFAVHREGLKMQLVGKTFAEAFKVMNLFYDNMKQLPGWGMTDNLPENHKKLFTESRDRLIGLLSTDATTPDAKVVSSLQLAVNEMLELRELLPMSTMNVGLKTGKAGKGKGEAKHVKILSQTQAKENNDKFLTMNAIIALFDADSSGIGIGEMNAKFKQRIMPGGVKPDGSVKKQIVLLVEQHLKSIEMAFPDVLPDENDQDLVRNILNDKLKTSVQKAIVADLQHIEDLESHYKKYAIQCSQQLNDKGTKNELKARKENWEYASLNKKLLVDSYEDLMGEKPNLKNILFFQGTNDKELDKIGRPSKKVKPTEDEIDIVEEKDEEDEIDIVVEKDEEDEIDIVEEKEELDSSDKEEEDIDEEELVEKEVRYSSLGIQLKFDKDMKIEGMGLEGRTQSPHGNTMGAHSTAWVVHLDAVKNQVIGSTPQEAIANVVKNLVNHAYKVEKERFGSFNVSKTHLNLMEKTKLDLEPYVKNSAPKDDTTAMIFLQNLIRTYLTYLNFIPGSTIDKGDTGGKAEGISRKRLNDFEKGGRAFWDELHNAYHKMLDKGNLDNKEVKILEKEHHEFMRMAYPNCYKALFEGKFKNQFYETAKDLSQDEQLKLKNQKNKKKKEGKNKRKRNPWDNDSDD